MSMFVTDNKELMSQWDYNKNNNIDLSKLTTGSEKEVWWLCTKGHSWKQKVNRRINHKCPYCSGRLAIKGVNDLKTLYPLLANEFDELKNEISSDLVSPRSGKKYWWKCSVCGYEWQATPHNRNNKSLSTGCPNCSKRTQTSYPEQVLFYYLRKNYSDTVNRYNDIFNNGMEIDIYIPSLQIGIEYDGELWHDGTDSYIKEKKKYDICKKNEIKLIRVKENYLGEKDTADIYITIKRHPNNDEIYRVINELETYIPLTKKFDLDNEESNIRASYMLALEKKSVAVEYSYLKEEWNYEKNKDLKPESIYSGSDIKVWWKCDKKHEWEATVSSRTRGSGCPYCAGKKVLFGFNDLRTTNAKLIEEWNYEKNSQNPENYTKSSNFKVWWKCNKGHEWEATINSRTHGNSCPYCSGRSAIKGINDLATTNPLLLKEWNYEKNNNLKPTDLKSGSGKKVWWKCGKGHEWEATIYNRISGTNCPYCNNKKVLVGYNDLMTTNYSLCKEWNYEKNKTMIPQMFTNGSHKKVWWKCDKGHEWEAEIRYRVRGTNCPYCK